MKIRLNGEVVRDGDARLYRKFGYDVCCPEDIRAAVENCREGEELVLELNSGGGSVYAGFEMYSIVRGYPGHTVGHVQSIAGSAMSAVMAGCDEVLMSPVANVMVHRASTSAWGNSRVMGETKQMLDTIDESILNAYEEKTKGKCSREKLRELMGKETFLTAQRAIELGFADGILPPGSGEDRADPKTAEACMFHTLPPVEDLRRAEMERRGQEEREGTKAIEKTANYFIREISDRLGIPQEILEGRRAGLAKTTEKPEQKETENLERSDGKMEQEREKLENVKQLEEAYPELVEQIRAEAAGNAAKAERERIAGIDEMAVAGFEDIVKAAKEDPKQNAGTVAQAIVRAQKEAGKSFLEGRKKDADPANQVPGAAAPKEEKDGDKDEAEAKAAAREAVKGYYGEKKEE